MKLNPKNFDKQRALEFLIAHAEKLVFGIFILLFLFLCLGGLKQTPYDKVPQQFVEKKNAVDTLLQNSKFDPTDPANEMPEIKKLPTAQDVPGRVYLTGDNPLNRPPVESRKRRPEPKFLPLVELQVSSGYGGVAIVDPMGAGNVAGAPAIAPAPVAGGRFRDEGRAGGNKTGLPPKADRGGAAAMRNDEGFARGRFGGVGAGGGVAVPAGASTKGVQWVMVTGLVPLAAQSKEYRDAFRDARHKDPRLDAPEYVSFAIERTEINPVPGAKPIVTELNIDEAWNERQKFAGKGEDPVDPLYIEQFLCDEPPPLIGPTHAGSVTHPKIPLRNQLGVGEAEATQADASETTRVRPKGGADAPVRGGPAANPMANRFGNPMANFRGEGRFGRGNMGPGSNAMAGTTGPKVDYTLFRFFDYSVKPGMTYKYRVKLILRNPNQNVPAQYLTRGDLARGETRESPWSEMSSTTSVSRGVDLMIGGIKWSKSFLTETKAEVLVKVWDPKAAVMAARGAEVARGQIADFPKPTAANDKGFVITDPDEVFNPETFIGSPSAAQEAEFPFHAESLVVDMTGGEPVKGVLVKSTSQILVLEPDGQLAVKSELAELDRHSALKKWLKAKLDASKPARGEEDEDRTQRRGRNDATGAAGGGKLDELRGNNSKGGGKGATPR